MGSEGRYDLLATPHSHVKDTQLTELFLNLKKKEDRRKLAYMLMPTSFMGQLFDLIQDGTINRRIAIEICEKLLQERFEKFNILYSEKIKEYIT